MAVDRFVTSSWSSVWKSDPWTSCSTNESKTEMMMAASYRCTEGGQTLVRTKLLLQAMSPREGLRTMVSRTAIEVRYSQPHVPGRFEQEQESDSQTMKKMGMEKRSWVILKVSCWGCKRRGTGEQPTREQSDREGTGAESTTGEDRGERSLRTGTTVGERGRRTFCEGTKTAQKACLGKEREGDGR